MMAAVKGAFVVSGMRPWRWMERCWPRAVCACVQLDSVRVRLLLEEPRGLGTLGPCKRRGVVASAVKGLGNGAWIVEVAKKSRPF